MKSIVKIAEEKTNHTLPALYRSNETGAVWLFTENHHSGVCLFNGTGPCAFGKKNGNLIPIWNNLYWTRLGPNDTVTLLND